MHELAGRLSQAVMNGVEDQALAREFEARLADSSSLAFRVAYSVLRHQQDAEDVAQEAFVRAHRRFRSLRDRERFRAWLARMTWRLALDHRRSQVRRLKREDRFVQTAHAPSPEDVALDGERTTRLWEAIDALPERLRLVVILASIEEHGVKEVAALVGVAEGTVKSRLFEARRRLRERLP